MIQLSKKGAGVKVIIWIVVLLVVVGAIYLIYNYFSNDLQNQNDNLSGNSNTQIEENMEANANVNTPTSDLDKPPVPPE